ncbi:unnamed protein product, partial [Rotaria socialis]
IASYQHISKQIEHIPIIILIKI